MKSKHLVEEKFEIVMESLTESISQAEDIQVTWNIPNTSRKVERAVTGGSVV